MKKLVCVLLVTALLFAVSISVFAESEKETAAKELETYGIVERNVLGELTIEGPVTRATMAKMLVMMQKITPEKTKTVFSDVPEEHWASGFVATAVDLRLVNGMGDGTFLPDEFITYEQAIKMIVCALGYGEDAERKGGYPYGYIMAGTNLGIIPDGVLVTDSADRGEIMIMLSKALDTPLMVMTSFSPKTGNSYTIMDGKNGVEYRTLRTMLEAE